MPATVTLTRQFVTLTRQLKRPNQQPHSYPVMFRCPVNSHFGAVLGGSERDQKTETRGECEKVANTFYQGLFLARVDRPTPLRP